MHQETVSNALAVVQQSLSREPHKTYQKLKSSPQKYPERYQERYSDKYADHYADKALEKQTNERYADAIARQQTMMPTSNQNSAQKRQSHQFSVITNKYMDNTRHVDNTYPYSSHQQTQENLKYPLSPSKPNKSKQNESTMRSRPTSGASPLKKSYGNIQSDFQRTSTTKSPMKVTTSSKLDSGSKRLGTANYDQIRPYAQNKVAPYGQRSSFRF